MQGFSRPKNIIFIEHRTSNVQHRTSNYRKYKLLLLTVPCWILNIHFFPISHDSYELLHLPVPTSHKPLIYARAGKFPGYY
jgi:hypothetical protein